MTSPAAEELEIDMRRFSHMVQQNDGCYEVEEGSIPFPGCCFPMGLHEAAAKLQVSNPADL